MIRFRRRTCITLSIFIFLVCLIMAGLKHLRPENAAFGSPFGLGLFPGFHRASVLEKIPDSENHLKGNTVTETNTLPAPKDKVYQLDMEEFPPPNYDLHIFYYTWYGNPQFDGKYIHWNHPLLKHWDAKIANSFPLGKHNPPDDVGANFYPELGPYSSRDPSVIDAHMKQIRSSSVGVISVSWYPPGISDDNGEPTDDFIPSILDKAHSYGLKVNFHIEPYRNRDDYSLRNNVVYIIDKYGSHPAFYKYKTDNGRTLPMFYIYDSYITTPGTWANLLTSSGSQSIRNTPYDGIFMALLVEEKHKHDILRGGFDGFYTYFATNGFSYGSSHQHWSSLKEFCNTNNLLFIPSVGPGYIDTSIRPWNFQNTRNRINGKYYETAINAALLVRPKIISITSFNEWHEGTQIEAAIPKKTAQMKYEDYLPHKPNIYLELTRKWSEKYMKEKEHWLV
ncbi:glycoprotein endo-alpha-1,2-mannosidase [Xenopus laevis]|uniref:Glycoprotein endo-alpha-1,2-mannosidase n=1 Tax=Xenopus laevis TaxID=8355 RepID=MANEA_XENLA|nr:glycoprotein endo-alpha-1,2-mannosidase [Xenopus laevis]Q6DE40.1 RecName: Full=Glycoprotein endo-alpha-1,2-mannosidase [Xenopus laevis]AAH77304.1 Manea-prov protein [Xenopus laevis]